MGLRLPIQNRDQVDVQTQQPVFSQQSIVTPVKSDLGAPLDKYADVLEKRNIAANKRAYQFLQAKFKNDVDDNVDKATQTVVSAQGENSFIAGDKAGKDLKQNLDKALLTIPEEHRTNFAVFADEGVRRFNKTSQGHQYGEQKKILAETFKQRANYLTDQAALNAYDPQSFDKNLQDLDSITEQYTRNTMGGDPDLKVEPSPMVRQAIDIQKQEAKSAAIFKAVSTLVSSDDTSTASQLAERYKSFLTGGDTKKVYDALRKGRVNDKANTAKQLFDEAVNLGDNKAGADYIRNADVSKDGEVYKQAIGMYQNHLNFNEQQRKELKAQTKADAMDKLRKNGGQLTDGILKSVDPEDKSDLIEYAQKVTRGETIPRNDAVYNNLYDMYLNRPEAFGKLNLQAYRHQMPLQDVDRMEGLQKEIRDPSTTKVTQAAVNDITSNIIRDKVATTFGYKTDGYKKQSAAIRAMGMEVLETVKASLPERASTDEVRKAFLKEMTTRTAKLENKTGWWDGLWGAPENMQPVQEPNVLKDSKYDVNATHEYDQYDPADVEAYRQEFVNRFSRTPKDAELLKTLRTAKQLGYLK